MGQYKSQEEAEAAGVYVSKVKSFVKREGRTTKAQARALEEFWPTMGIEYTGEPVDLKQVFGRDAPVVLEIGFGMGASVAAPSSQPAREVPARTRGCMRTAQTGSRG